jgi:hypothetical protein
VYPVLDLPLVVLESTPPPPRTLDSLINPIVKGRPISPPKLTSYGQLKRPFVYTQDLMYQFVSFGDTQERTKIGKFFENFLLTTTEFSSKIKVHLNTLSEKVHEYELCSKLSTIFCSVADFLTHFCYILVAFAANLLQSFRDISRMLIENLCCVLEATGEDFPSDACAGTFGSIISFWFISLDWWMMLLVFTLSLAISLQGFYFLRRFTGPFFKRITKKSSIEDSRMSFKISTYLWYFTWIFTDHTNKSKEVVSSEKVKYPVSELKYLAENAFQNAHVTNVTNDSGIVLVSVDFYSKGVVDGGLEVYNHVGQGTIVRRKMGNRKELKHYLVTAKHVLNQSNHWSLASSRGYKARRYTRFPPANKLFASPDMDVGYFEVTNSELGKNSCPGSPGWLAADINQTTDKPIINDREQTVLLVCGRVHPETGVVGNYCSSGRSIINTQIDEPYLFAHNVATRPGWSGAALFASGSTKTPRAVGIHVGGNSQENRFVIADALSSFMDDTFEEALDYTQESRGNERNISNRWLDSQRIDSRGKKNARLDKMDGGFDRTHDESATDCVHHEVKTPKRRKKKGKKSKIGPENLKPVLEESTEPSHLNMATPEALGVPLPAKDLVPDSASLQILRNSQAFRKMEGSVSSELSEIIVQGPAVEKPKVGKKKTKNSSTSLTRLKEESTSEPNLISLTTLQEQLDGLSTNINRVGNLSPSQKTELRNAAKKLRSLCPKLGSNGDFLTSLRKRV